MITDGTLSPGDTDAKGNLIDPKDYQGKQQIEITTAMKSHLQKYSQTSVVLYMMLSKFKTGKGDVKYYDRHNKGKDYNGYRPFYIWVFGNCEDIAYLKARVGEPRFGNSEIIDKFEIARQDKDLKYLVKPNKGDRAPYESTNTNEVCVKNQGKGKGDGYTFFVLLDYANYKGLTVDEEFLLDTSNYMTGDTLVSIKDVNKFQGSEYSYELTIELANEFFHQNKKEKEVKVWFNEKCPDWSERDDTVGEGPVEGKTFGIKMQVESIFDAYSSKDGKCAELTFKVSKFK